MAIVSGQARRWVIDNDNLTEISKRLRSVSIKSKDFEEIIDNCVKGDFIFIDPPYSSGKKETLDLHYNTNRFRYEDHVRLSKILKKVSRRGVKWAMTTSSHVEITKLYVNFNKYPIDNCIISLSS